MGSSEKSKKRIQQWKKAAIHFSLCFVMGFFIGFAPTGTSSLFSFQPNSDQSINNLNSSLISQIPAKTPKISNISTKNPTPIEEVLQEEEEGGGDDDNDIDTDTKLSTHNLLIIITTIKIGDRFRGPFLRRLSHTLKLVSWPLLWIVVEAHDEAPHTSDLLRRTGIMYRHLTYKENFSDPNVEADHQRNAALNYIEYHRLNGIVHFADVDNVYDLRFIEEMRDIGMFGTWPVGMVSTKRVTLEGPICKFSKVVGWEVKELDNGTIARRPPMLHATRPMKINISGFSFNSSILWDPERWGRPSSIFDTSQDSIKFVQEVVLEDEAKLKAIPSDCSQIRLWHLHIPRSQHQNKK